MTMTLSHWCEASRLANGVPKNADANSLFSTGSFGRGAIRSSISTQLEPASSVSSAGTFSMNAFAVTLSPSPYETVV